MSSLLAGYVVESSSTLTEENTVASAAVSATVERGSRGFMAICISLTVCCCIMYPAMKRAKVKRMTTPDERAIETWELVSRTIVVEMLCLTTRLSRQLYCLRPTFELLSSCESISNEHNSLKMNRALTLKLYLRLQSNVIQLEYRC